MIKIFYKNKLLILSENILNDNCFTKINVSDKDNIKNSIYNFLTEEKYSALNIFGEKEDYILHEISENFILINASGGIVNDKFKRILVIKRLGYYDFPKGKIEANETFEESAIREVSEECGINQTDLQIFRPIDNSFHIYTMQGEFVLKKTSWYEMIFTGDYDLKPQTEENITNVEWIERENLSGLLKESYPSISNLANFYLALPSLSQSI